MKKCIHFPLLMTKSPVEVNILDILTIKMTNVLLLARILAFDATVQSSTASFITRLLHLPHGEEVFEIE